MVTGLMHNSSSRPMNGGDRGRNGSCWLLLPCMSSPPRLASPTGRILLAVLVVLILGALWILSVQRQQQQQPLSGNNNPHHCPPYSPSALAKYTDLLSYPLRTPDLAIDAIMRVYTKSGALSGIVLCHRRDPPHRLAIPGGYVEYGESVEDAAKREVLEETNIDLSAARSGDVSVMETQWVAAVEDGATIAVSPSSLTARRSGTFSSSSIRQFHVFSNPLRDKRRHTVSVAFDIVVVDQTPRAGDDAKECRMFSIPEIRSMDPKVFAFDHHLVLMSFLDEFEQQQHHQL